MANVLVGSSASFTMLPDQQRRSGFQRFATMASFLSLLFFGISFAPQTTCASSPSGRISQGIYQPGGRIEDNYFGAAIALSKDGLCAAITSQTTSGVFAVYTYVMNQTTGSFVQRGGQLTLADGSTPFSLGQTLSFNANGSVLAVAAPFFDSDRGAIYIFRRYSPEGNWTQAEGTFLGRRNFAVSSSPGDFTVLGIVMELSRDGNTLIAGLQGSLILQRPLVAIWNAHPNGTWTLTSTFYPDDVSRPSNFGTTFRFNAVAVHPRGNQFVAGRSIDSTTFGYFWVVSRNPATGKWNQTSTRYDYTQLYFGRSMSYSPDGNHLAITSSNDVTLWAVESPRYRLVQTIRKPTSPVSTRFAANGGSCDFAGNRLIIGDDELNLRVAGGLRLGGVVIYTLNSLANAFNTTPELLTVPVDLLGRSSGNNLDLGSYVRGSDNGFALVAAVRDDARKGSVWLITPPPPTQAPTQSPTPPTNQPSLSPSARTVAPTVPTQAPSQAPTPPTHQPSLSPSARTAAPTMPTPAPTQSPTPPTHQPSLSPSVRTVAPTVPTRAPTVPTRAPTVPTQAPTVPTQAPTVPNQAPTNRPSLVPSQSPTKVTTQRPSRIPSQAPSKVFTQVPTQVPTLRPTNRPTQVGETLSPRSGNSSATSLSWMLTLVCTSLTGAIMAALL